jgi:hypothetical protein
MCTPNENAMMAITSRVEIVTPKKRFFFKKEGCAERVSVVIFGNPYLLSDLVVE